MSSSIVSPFPFFTDTTGAPLEGGYIYIGQSNLNPETAPVNVFWDAALTIPAAQPVRTVGGYPSRQGTPSRFYSATDTYSITVRNKNRALVFSAFDQSDSPTSVFDISTQLITATAGQTTFTLTTFTYLPGTDTLQIFRNGLRLNLGLDYLETNSSTVTLTAPAAVGDQFLFQGGAVITGDQTPGSAVSFIQAGTGAVTRNMQDKARESVSVLDFGAVGDYNPATGTGTDDTAAIQAAINYAISVRGTVLIPSGYIFAVGELYLDSVEGCSITGERNGHSVSGSKSSTLLYTGTGSCITIGDQSGSGDYQYRFFLSKFNIFFSQNAFAGIRAKNISECSFDDVSVFADTKVVQNGIKIDGGLIVFINQCTTSNTLQGINLISGSTPNTQQNFGVYITQCNLWNHTNSILLGGSHGVNIYGNWIEAFQNAIFINNLSDSVTGLEILSLSINDNVLVQSKQGLTETRAIRIANFSPREQFYIFAGISNNYIRMDANLATRPTYAISVDLAGSSEDADITLCVRDNIFFGVTGAAIFADDYRTVIPQENNKAVAQYGSAVQAPVTAGPYTDLSSSYTLIQNGIPLFAPLDTIKNTIFTVTVNGKFIPASGSIRIKTSWQSSNNSANDYIRIRLGSSSGPILMEKNVANRTSVACETSFFNANSKTSGRSISTIIDNSGASTYAATTSVDVSGNYNLIFEVEKANASTSIALDTFVVEVLP
jgi:hypothetical protein